MIAVVLFVMSGKASTKGHHIQATDTSKVGDLVSLVREIAAEMPGTGTGFTEYCELKGTIACDEPIRGELSDELVAICDTRVERVIERQHEKRDEQGNVRTEWKKETETVSSNRRVAPLFVDDGTGRIRVKETKKDIELVKVVDRFEPASAIEQSGGGQVTLTLGKFQLSVGGRAASSGSRTLGYHFTESVLPIGRRVYALGEVADSDDEGLVLRRPTGEQKKRPFMLSLKTEEELVTASAKSAKTLKIVAACLAAVGVALAIWHVVS